MKLDNTDNKYHSYLFMIPYDPFLPTYFNNHHKFMKTNFSDKINKNGYFEKSKMQWFSKNDLIKEKSKFRLFYKDIVQQIIDKYDIIYKIITNLKIKNKV